MEGASPRMRGKVFFFTGVSFCAIFFLEPSGNLLLEPSGSSWVPPDGSIFVFAIGSPPRMRGKECLLGSAPNPFGITPAYAGKRYDFYSICYRRWDHPRVCGEKSSPILDCKSPVGSPPRMRGKGIVPEIQRTGCGITPAYAGKRCPRDRGAGQNQDYPRVCGEKEIAAGRDVAYWGSPPRVRGKDGCRIDVDFGIGITPACAGKRRPESLLHT